MTKNNGKLLVGSNLKMYKTSQQTLEYMRELQEITRDIDRADLTLFILPSYTSLPDACRQADHSLLKIGAQNMHWEEQGQYTGEVSPRMLKEIGVDVVMIGHAERRQMFGETDWMVNKRVRTSLRYGFQTLVCVGETAEDKKYQISRDRLIQQLKVALYGVEENNIDQIWIAYEPVWAIGEGGQVADPIYVNEMHTVLQDTLTDLFHSNGDKIPLLYGGSVNPDNAKELIQQPHIDGLFIGRSAWEAPSFNTIIRKALENYKGTKI
jgi:L-erythrulose 1-phosphate isomerase